MRYLSFSRRSLGIFIPLSIKGLGIIFSFFLVKIIIDRFGFAVYGEYASVLSLFAFFFAVSNLGVPQKFIMSSAGKSSENIKSQSNDDYKFIIINAVLLLPLCCYFIIYKYEFSNISLLLLMGMFLLSSGSRFRFFVIRAGHNRAYSEFPEIIIKPICIFAVLFYFEQQGVEFLFFGLFFANVVVVFFQYFLIENKFDSIPNIFEFNFKKTISRIKKEVDGVFFFNLSSVGKDLFDIYVAIYLIGLSSAGQFKVVLQFLIGFLAVYNAANLVNSITYASYLKNNDKDNIKIKLSREFWKSSGYLLLMMLLFYMFESRFGVFDYFSLSEPYQSSFWFLLIIPIYSVLVGPSSQLLVHTRQSIWAALGIHIRCVMLILFYYIFDYNEGRFVFSYIGAELMYLTFLAMVVRVRLGICPAVFYGTKTLINLKRLC